MSVQRGDKSCINTHDIWKTPIKIK